MSRPDPAALPNGLAWSLGSGTVLQGFNSSVLAVALVSIGAHFGDTSALPWIVSALYISAAVCSPAGGRMADLFGPRRVYLVGLVITMVAALLGPFAPSAGWLIADRVLLGVGTSLQFPTAMAIIRRQAQLRGAVPSSALGIIALCGQTTAALGPSIGGPIVSIWGWQGIFWVNIPLVLNSLWWVSRHVPADESPRKQNWRAVVRLIDPVGLVLFVATLVPLMLGLLSLDADPQWGWFAAFAGTAGLLVAWSLRSTHPFLDVRLLGRNRTLTAVCIRAVFTFVSFYTVFYGMPQWLEAERGLSPALTGALMFPIFGVGVASTALATRLGKRAAPARLLVIGSCAMVLAGLVAIFAITSAAPIWLLIAFGALLGLPNGFNNLGNQLTLHGAVESEYSGVASGLYRTSQYIGAALAAVVTAFALSTDSPMTMLGICVAGLGVVLLVEPSIESLKRRS